MSKCQNDACAKWDVNGEFHDCCWPDCIGAKENHIEAALQSAPILGGLMSKHEIRHMCAAILIAELESERPAWVSVEDRLPEVGSHFIVYDTYYIGRDDDVCPVKMGRMTKSWGIAPEGMNGVCDTITHWMPLPSPPEDSK